MDRGVMIELGDALEELSFGNIFGVVLNLAVDVGL
jgi:hypothetical protein